MADLMNVEIARVGEWKLASGPLDVTPQMLVDAAAYAGRSEARPSPVRLGHGDPRFDGEPALGWLQNLRVEGTGADTVLVGDILDMPDWLAEAAPKHWPDRSMEGWTDMEADGRTYGLVVDGLALLGVSPPGMSSLRSLRDLPQALGVAASARIAATFQTPDPADGAGSTTHTQGVLMDPVKIREGLGLPADATDEDVTQALVTAGLAPAAPTAAAPAAPAPTPAAAPPAAVVTPPATPVTPGPMPTAPPTPEQIAAAANAGPGTMVIDAAAWAAREESIARLEAAEAKRRLEERDQVIGQAIHAGKFPPVRREHWAAVWDKDPEGTRTLIDGLTPNVVPVTAMGELGTSEDSLDEEYAHLFPPTPKGA